MEGDGFRKRIYCEYRLFNMYGDTQWFRGTVTKKYVEGEDHLVDCKIWAVNQREQITTPGEARVIFLSKTTYGRGGSMIGFHKIL